jgi:hypothetical protein
VSVKVSSAVWENSKAKGTARLVLLALADEAADNGDVTAYKRSRSHLETKCAASASAVKAAVKKLVELGEIVVLDVGSGRDQTNYRITIEGVRIDPSQIGPPGGQNPPRQGGRIGPPGGVKKNPPSSRSLPGTPVLPGMKEPPPPATSIEIPPGKAIAIAVWEASERKPATKFVAVTKIATTLLDSGWTHDQIVAAMLAVPTISTGWVEAELNKSRPRAGARAGRAPSSDRDAASGLIIDA